MLSRLIKSFSKTSLNRHKALSEEIEADPVLLARIVRLQQMFRARRALSPPYSIGNSYPWMVGGNEPDLQPMPVFQSGRFALMGCSCLRSIEVLFRLYDREQSPPSPDGYTNVPKLFLVDNSINVITAWKRLKKLVLLAHSRKEFIHLFDKNTMLFDDLSLRYGGDCEVCSFLIRFKTFCKTNEDYGLFKNIVSKATIICGDWRDLRIINYVRKHSEGQPIAVYTSNIPEFLLHNRGTREFSRLINNIVSLKPYATIYALTRLDRYKRESVLYPEIMISQKGFSKEEHLEGLRAGGESYLTAFISPTQSTQLARI